MVKQCGWSTAFLAGTGHEIWDQGRIPLYEERSASMMDLHNNAEGRDCGKGNNECKTEKKEKSCDECCREKLRSGDLIYFLGHGASGGW
jgi:hypothetical protein